MNNTQLDDGAIGSEVWYAESGSLLEADSIAKCGHVRLLERDLLRERSHCGRTEEHSIADLKVTFTNNPELIVMKTVNYTRF